MIADALFIGQIVQLDFPKPADRHHCAARALQMQ
jgi:hypothetical protein